MDMFLGIDLNGFKRPSAIALLDGNRIYFDDWRYDKNGKNLILSENVSVIAIDGPAGFSGRKDTFRRCERLLNTPGKTYYSLEDCKAYPQLIDASTQLFWNLYRKEEYSLFGVEKKAETTLIEVWPLSGWRAFFKSTLKQGRYIPGKKTSLEGQKFMKRSIEERGYMIEGTRADPPSDHYLDAAMAAITAEHFKNGDFKKVGDRPEEDKNAQCLREGYIIVPSN